MAGKKKSEAAQKEQEQKAPEVAEDNDRAAMYAAYNKSQGGEQPEEISEPSPEEEGTGKEEYESPESSEEDVTESSPEEEEETPGDTDEPEKEEKMVPHGAFHEERERRKTLQKEVTELQDQVKVLIKDNRDFMERLENPGKEATELDKLIEEGDIDAATRAILEENRALKGRIDKLEQSNTQRTENETREQIERDNAEFQKRLDKTNEKLEKEGFPGFSMLTDAVGRELTKLFKDDPDSAPPDNEEGWEKVYKEVVYPEYRKTFVSKDRQDIMDGKMARKQKANIGKGGGAPEGKKKKGDEEWTFNDYMEMRKAGSRV